MEGESSSEPQRLLRQTGEKGSLRALPAPVFPFYKNHTLLSFLGCRKKDENCEGNGSQQAKF